MFKIISIILIIIINVNVFPSFKILPTNLSIKKLSHKWISTIEMTSSSAPPSSGVTDTYSDTIDLLYDSECPICQMEVDFLQKRDIHNRIRFTDLSSPNYNPEEHGNVSFEKGMRKIRAVLPDKTVITGVEVFRRTYEAIGLGWMFEITKLPIIGQAADALYDIWAENRLRITGRGDLADVLKEKSEILRDAEPIDCDSDACEIDWDAPPPPSLL